MESVAWGCNVCGSLDVPVGPRTGRCEQCQKERQRKRSREYQRKHQKARRAARSPEKVALDNARRLELRRLRIKEDHQYCVERRLQKGFRQLFQRKKVKKPKELHGKWRQFIGCSWEELMAQFERQFKESPHHSKHGQMGWHNKQHWHIDHIFPSSRCSMENIFQLLIVWNHNNLRPLWKAQNMEKMDSITTEGVEIVLELAKQSIIHSPPHGVVS